MFLEIKRFLSCRMILSSSVPSSLDMLEVVQECAVMIGRPVKSVTLPGEAVEISLCTLGKSFMKGYSVLVRVEIIHKSKFLPGTVEKNSSTIRSSGRNRTYACAMPVHCSDH